MRKCVLCVFAGLLLLAGCGSADEASKVPAKPKWQGAPYHIAFAAPAAKPQPGIVIPGIKYNANPDMLENRVTLIVRFDAPQTKKDRPMINQMIMVPADISGADGALPADYIAAANKGLAGLLDAYCVKGKLKITVAIARSSLTSQAGDAEIEAKRLSDWTSTDAVFKSAHPAC